MLKLITSLTRRQKGWVLVAIDLALIPLAMLGALTLQASPQPPVDALLGALPVLPYILTIAASILLWTGLPVLKLKEYEGRAVLLTVLYAGVVTVASAGLIRFHGQAWPAGTFIMFGILLFLFAASVRLAMYQVVVAVYRRSRPRTRVLIYGAGTTGSQLASALKAHETIDPVAFVDDNKSLQGQSVMGFPVYQPARIGQIVSERRIDRVLLAMPSLSPPKLAQISRRLQKMGLEVQALPSFAQLIGEEALVDKLSPVQSQDFLGRKANDMVLGAAAEAYANRVVLVSGAGGSIGSEICRQVLACRPRKLVLYELSELALYTVDMELRQLGEDTDIALVPVLGSVTDLPQVRTVLAEQGVQVVLHAAAYKHVPMVESNPLPGLANNVLGTQTLAAEAAAFGVERFLLVSTDKAVRPTSVMGASKRLAELVVQELASRMPGTVFSIVRFGNVLGSSGSVLPLFQEQVARGGPVTVTDPSVKRFFMTIGEAVQLVLTAAADARGGEVFVLDMGAPVSIMQLARQVIEANGYHVRDAEHPEGDIEIAVIGLRRGEKIEEELSHSGDLVGTRNRKIFTVEETRISEIEVASMLRALRHALTQSDTQAGYDVIRRWVDGYKSPDPAMKRS